MDDISASIERMVEIEAQLGIKLSALSAFIDEDGDVKLFGEAHFSRPPTEDGSASVHVMAYDAEGRMVGKSHAYIGSKGVSFDAFDLLVYGPAKPVKRVRVFLKKE
jgi:hypothetical protein